MTKKTNDATAAAEIETPAATETTETTEAEVQAEVQAEAPAAPAAPARYADEDTAKAIADRLAAIKTAGWTRPMLMAVMDMNGSAVWRAQNKKIHPDEVATVTKALNRIESGELTPPAKPVNRRSRKSRDELAHDIEQLALVLDQIRTAKSIKDVRGLADQGLTMIRGEAGDKPAAPNGTDK